MESLTYELENLKESKGITKFEDITEQYYNDLEEQRAYFDRELSNMRQLLKERLNTPYDPP